MLMLAAALWILVIVSLKMGLPWGDLSFTSSYGGILLFCYFLTGLSTMKALKLRPKWWSAGEYPSGRGMFVDSCPTCETFCELTDGFSDLPPKVEAIYVEHLGREHQIEP